MERRVWWKSKQRLETRIDVVGREAGSAAARYLVTRARP